MLRYFLASIALLNHVSSIPSTTDVAIQEVHTTVRIDNLEFYNSLERVKREIYRLALVSDAALADQVPIQFKAWIRSREESMIAGQDIDGQRVVNKNTTDADSSDEEIELLADSESESAKKISPNIRGGAIGRTFSKADKVDAEKVDVDEASVEEVRELEADELPALMNAARIPQQPAYSGILGSSSVRTWLKLLPIAGVAAVCYLRRRPRPVAE